MNKSVEGVYTYGLGSHTVCHHRPVVLLFPWLPAVDDGSGVLSCCQWRRSEDSEEGLYLPSIGQLVSVFGRVEEFRGEKQLRVLAIGKV